MKPLCLPLKSPLRNFHWMRCHYGLYFQHWLYHHVCAGTASSQTQSVQLLGLSVIAVSVSYGLAVRWQKVWTLPSQAFPAALMCSSGAEIYTYCSLGKSQEWLQSSNHCKATFHATSAGLCALPSASPTSPPRHADCLRRCYRYPGFSGGDLESRCRLIGITELFTQLFWASVSSSAKNFSKTNYFGGLS